MYIHTISDTDDVGAYYLTFRIIFYVIFSVLNGVITCTLVIIVNNIIYTKYMTQ